MVKAEKKKAKIARGDADQGLGTFIGVFTPTLLTILGVIMYLRFGWVLGNLGLTETLCVVVLANAITLVTTLSFSAIATNTHVGVGGAYYMISRSLGLEIGGAIGIPLFLSQVFSVTLYGFGLAETLNYAIPGLPLKATTFVVIIAVGALSFKGAKIALKSQLPIMVLVGVSIIALTAGALLQPTLVSQDPSPAVGDASFWEVFAVFFPAVTGVMAGLGLSGDLKQPRRSIPLGAISATLTGFAIYMLIVAVLWQGADAGRLLEPMVWTEIAMGGTSFVIVGLWGAIFSSAVGSMLGAPRTLQALIEDHAGPTSWANRIFVPTDGKEPKTGLIISMALALGAVFLGDLNHVAAVVTMFFLTVYGAVNLVAALETLSGDATWRPRLKCPWFFSLGAGIACFIVMFLINPTASIVAIFVELILWFGFQSRERTTDWGDMRRDIYEALIRWALLKLRERPMTARNWRPHVLVFTDVKSNRINLARYGSWFSQNRGVVTVCELVEGDVLDPDIHLEGRRQDLCEHLALEGISAFEEVDVVSSIDAGLLEVSQASGIAGLEPNTILLGWPRVDRLPAFLCLLSKLDRLNKSLLIAKIPEVSLSLQGRHRRIDVWWGGLERNGDLMLLLAHLLTRNADWRDANIQICSIASNETICEENRKKLDELLHEARIDASTKLLIKPKQLSIHELIHRESADADVVFLGLRNPLPQERQAYAQRLHELSEGLGTVFFVKNASLFVGELV
jgi:solute carrier family 12 (potassium/chloride transporter), member 4/6